MPDRPLYERLLVQQAIRHPAAFETLYELYVSRVLAFVRRRIDNHHDAEDVTSEVFLQAFKSLSDIRNQRQFSFAQWLFTIARRQVIDFYRRQGRTPDTDALETVEELMGEHPEMEAELLLKEQQAELYLILSRLPARRRAVLVLRYVAGMRNVDIALHLHLTERTVAAHVTRGLRDVYAAYALKHTQNPTLPSHTSIALSE